MIKKRQNMAAGGAPLDFGFPEARALSQRKRNQTAYGIR